MRLARFEQVSRLFVNQHLTRSQALARSGLRSPAMLEGTPEAGAARGPEMLFIQSFQSGSIAPADGADGRYTVTLEHGLGQTIYFSDRPERIVGASPTAQFLTGLGFDADNPPNAALVIENANGETDFAVVELFNPVYDAAGPTVTYEAAVLENWEDSTDLGFTAAPSDLGAIASSFGAAHLFIDDCADGVITCFNTGRQTGVGEIPNADHKGFCYSWSQIDCLPCEPWIPNGIDATVYWSNRCNELFSACNGYCQAYGAA